jgi:hypothetical protein
LVPGEKTKKGKEKKSDSVGGIIASTAQDCALRKLTQLVIPQHQAWTSVRREAERRSQ